MRRDRFIDGREHIMRGLLRWLTSVIIGRIARDAERMFRRLFESATAAGHAVRNAGLKDGVMTYDQ